MAVVIVAPIPTQHRCHQFREWQRPGLHQQVAVVGHEGPGEALAFRPCQALAEPIQEIPLVGVIRKYVAALQTPADQMVASAGYM